jgi:hypothetical protein
MISKRTLKCVVNYISLGQLMSTGSALHLLSPWFLARLDPEDGGDMFLRNVG